MTSEHLLDIHLGEEIEEPLSMPMSLEEEIFLSQPLDVDEELILIEEYTHYLRKFLRSREKIQYGNMSLLFPLNLNLEKVDKSLKKQTIRLYLDFIKELGFSYRTNPLIIIDEEEPKKWVEKGSLMYPIIERVLAFYILIGMKMLSIKLLEILVQIHKQNKEKINIEDFKKWNKIIASYYEAK